MELLLWMFLAALGGVVAVVCTLAGLTLLRAVLFPSQRGGLGNPLGAALFCLLIDAVFWILTFAFPLSRAMDALEAIFGP